MGVGRQSRRVCFGAKPDKGFLDLKSRRTRKWYGEANESWRRDPRERQLVAGPERELVAGEQRGKQQKAVGGWRPEKELVAGDQQRSWWLDPRMRVGGWSPGETVGSWTGAEGVGGWTRERSGGWTVERQLVVGQEKRSWWLDPREELVVGQERRSWWLDPREELVVGQERSSWWLESREASSRRQLRLETTEGSWDWTRERRTERLAWIHGGAVNTRHRNREARRQDRVQWRRVSRCLIPVALWNFR